MNEEIIDVVNMVLSQSYSLLLYISNSITFQMVRKYGNNTVNVRLRR